VHCAALTETLLESELFGHEKGAFTGAVSQQAGRFESAHGGTIFLDEIGEVPPATQVKLLRVLQEKAFERVGGATTVHCDVRVIAATNRDLKAEIANGNFREDLFYRLNVFPVILPPLRQRREDIPLLVEYFAAQAAEKMGQPSPRMTTDASAVLTTYDWPGNVRELQNVMERSAILSHGEPIDVNHLPVEIAGGMVPSNDGGSSGGSLWDFERSMIVKALKDAAWNQSKAARALGISRDNLRYRIKKYEILREE
jgi:transcriptional regulator with GAF, ATPase, and Fis domain